MIKVRDQDLKNKTVGRRRSSSSATLFGIADVAKKAVSSMQFGRRKSSNTISAIANLLKGKESKESKDGDQNPHPTLRPVGVSPGGATTNSTRSGIVHKNSSVVPSSPTLVVDLENLDESLEPPHALPPLRGVQ